MSRIKRSNITNSYLTTLRTRFYALEKIMEFDPKAKVVAVTADITIETQQRLDDMNVTAIIYKPFDQNEIKKVLMEKYEISIS